MLRNVKVSTRFLQGIRSLQKKKKGIYMLTNADIKMLRKAKVEYDKN